MAAEIDQHTSARRCVGDPEPLRSLWGEMVDVRAYPSFAFAPVDFTPAEVAIRLCLYRIRRRNRLVDEMPDEGAPYVANSIQPEAAIYFPGVTLAWNLKGAGHAVDAHRAHDLALAAVTDSVWRPVPDAELCDGESWWGIAVRSAHGVSAFVVVDKWTGQAVLVPPFEPRLGDPMAADEENPHREWVGQVHRSGPLPELIAELRDSGPLVVDETLTSRGGEFVEALRIILATGVVAPDIWSLDHRPRHVALTMYGRLAAHRQREILGI